MKQIVDFLEQLEINNDRDRFHAHQNEYQAVRKEVLALAQRLIDKVSDFFDLSYDLRPQDCIFRINRDTRFSKDKTPYKTNFGIEISQAGKRNGLPCFYLHIQPGDQSFIAGGLYMPDSKTTEIIREGINTHGEQLQKILDTIGKSKQFYLYEDAVKTSPRGYKKDNPHIELLKLKHRILERNVKDSELLSENFEKTLIKDFKKISPLVERLQDVIFNDTKNRSLSGMR